MNITVYCGSNFGYNADYQKAAKELGLWLGNKGHTLVYGGGRNGLMGEIARATMEAGGQTIGVIPTVIANLEQELVGLSQVFHVDTMFERKNKMIELGEAFIAMPGGVGTLEETAEILSLIRIGLVDKPCIIYNIDGYYEYFNAFLDHMVKEGFLKPSVKEQYKIVNNLQKIEACLEV